MLPNAYAIERTFTIFKDCYIVSRTGPLLVAGIGVSTTKKERERKSGRRGVRRWKIKEDKGRINICT